MDYDFYAAGLGEGVWINTGHWYADPFSLYSDYKIDHVYESVLFAPDLQTVHALLYEQQSMYFLSMMINQEPTPTPNPVPVPEPSSACLLCMGLFVMFFFNKVLTTANR